MPEVLPQGEAPGGDPGSAFGGGATRARRLGRTLPGAGGPTSGPSNFTDPESQIMKTSSEGLAITRRWRSMGSTRSSSRQVGPQASDQGLNETFGVEPAVVLADAGYCNEPDLLELEDRGIRTTARWRSTRPGSLPRTAWVRNWRAPRAKPGTRNAGSRRRRTGGSRRCSGEACEAWRRCAASGTSCLAILRQVLACQRTCSGARSAHRPRMKRESLPFRPSAIRCHTRAKIPPLRRPRANRL